MNGIIAVGDRMFLGIQDFDFCPYLIKFCHNFTEFTQILPDWSKFTEILPKFCPNLPKKNCYEMQSHPRPYATEWELIWDPIWDPIMNRTRCKNTALNKNEVHNLSALVYLRQVHNLIVILQSCYTEVYLNAFLEFWEVMG